MRRRGKDADSLTRLGLIGTSVATGNVDLSAFTGRVVHIHEDNDPAGRSKASKLAERLHGIALEIRVIRYTELSPGGDVTDWLERGHTFEDLLAKRDAAEVWQPPTGPSEDTTKPWPKQPDLNLFGIIGDLAALATRNSEADPIAVAATAVAWGAAMFGRNCYMSVGDTVHHPRHFAALVGASSRARKGTSLEPVRRIFNAAEQKLRAPSTIAYPGGLPLKISHGPLSSGEGLLDVIRDKRDDEDAGGVEDKRLFCVEAEFGAVLRAAQRQGNTLSTTLRVAWDGATIEPLTKHQKVRVTDPHICVVGHITNQELRQLTTASDIFNGFFNRFLWFAVRRRGAVPFPERMPDADVDRMASEIANLMGKAHDRSGDRARFVLSNSAHSHWGDCYIELTRDHPGILGAVTSRAEAQVLRLSMTFALFDGADRIELKHLDAALALWRYAFDSAAYIFNGSELDRKRCAEHTLLI